MRKKPDILLLLVVLVVSGVVLSNVVIFKENKHFASTESLMERYSQLELDKNNNNNKVLSKLNSHDVAHIDSSKQQTH